MTRSFVFIPLFQILMQPVHVVLQALVVVGVEAFALDDPESFEILLVQGGFDFQPVDVGFRGAHGALHVEAAAIIGHAGFEAL